MRTAPVRHETRRQVVVPTFPPGLQDREGPDLDGPHPDELFDALDGKVLNVASQLWRIHVYSISDHDGARWIQLGLGVRPAHSLTLKTAVDDGAEAVLASITHRIASTR